MTGSLIVGFGLVMLVVLGLLVAALLIWGTKR
jgi:hypothetical protein